jgi:hypothetical protein
MNSEMRVVRVSRASLRRPHSVVHTLAVILVWACSVSLTDAAVITVGTGGCTLRDAIRAADADAARGDCPAGSGTDTINLPNGHVVLLNSDLPVINTPMTIQAVSGEATVDRCRTAPSSPTRPEKSVSSWRSERRKTPPW